MFLGGVLATLLAVSLKCIVYTSTTLRDNIDKNDLL